MLSNQLHVYLRIMKTAVYICTASMKPIHFSFFSKKAIGIIEAVHIFTKCSAPGVIKYFILKVFEWKRNQMVSAE